MTSRTREAAAVLAVFLVALVTLIHGMLFASWSENVPVNVARGFVEGRAYPRAFADETDHQFVIWLAGRNAQTLLTAPQRLFDAEPCHPTENALALGEPGISMGLMGIPAWIVSGDPIATYNFVFVLVCIVSFAAMFLLVREWTASPTAATVAALLYTFHEVKIKDSVHFFAWDGSWTVLALYFVTRLVERRRWSDAIGLALSISMQLVGSLYPLLAAALVALPVLVWLGIRNGVREQKPLQWAFVVAVALIVAVPVFTPFLTKIDTGVLAERSYQVFTNFRWLVPGGPGFPGWMQIGLVVAAFALPRRFVVTSAGGPDPRWVMLVIAVLALSVSAGGNTAARLEAMQRGDPLPPAFPDLYTLLAAVVPGMKQIRGPAALYSAVHLALCVLAGLGVAGILRTIPDRFRTLSAALLVALTWLELMRPPIAGLTARIDYVPVAMRPPAEEIAFHQALLDAGSTGPLLELPHNPRNLRQSARATLLAAWHGRRTAQCYNSHIPPETDRVKAISDRLPDAGALTALSDLGFTTILIHRSDKPGNRGSKRDWQRELAPMLESGRIELLRESEALVAYEIVVVRESPPVIAEDLPIRE